MSLYKKVTALFITCLLSFPLYAMNLDQAKQALGQAKSMGLVGEQTNGYLGIIQNQGNATEIVQLINTARKQQYQTVAKQSNAPLSEVENIAGQKAQEKTPTGQYIQINGQWKKK